MFELVFLGTSAMAPSVHRGLSAQAVLAGELRFLVDCGEGTQRQILRSGIGFKKLNRILLTHAHLDHILGLGGLISTLVRGEDVDDIEIWGGKATIDRVQTLLYDVVLRPKRPPAGLHLIDISHPGEIIKARQFTVSAFPVQHRGPGCFGYVFQEKTHTPFLVDQAEALGVPAGPERGRLVRGETVTLADGRVITPDRVLGATQRGVKLAITGDLGRTDTVVEAVRDADVLVCEATFMETEREEAEAFRHLTARQAAELARAAGVRTLILTHISRRYRERDVLEEAQRFFPDTVIARDLDHFVLRRGQPVERLPRQSHSFSHTPEDEVVDESAIDFPPDAEA